MLIILMTGSVVTFSYVSSCIFYGWVSVHVGQLAEAESVRIVAGVGESINDDGVRGAVEDLTNTAIKLVVCYTGPVRWLLKKHTQRKCQWKLQNAWETRRNNFGQR